jgi:hypothetical protein
LASPNGMKLLGHLHTPKSLSLAKIQLNWLLHVSGTSKSLFWTRWVICKATILKFGSFLSTFHRVIVLLILNLLDISLEPYLLSVAHSFYQTVSYSKLSLSVPINPWPFSLIYHLQDVLASRDLLLDIISGASEHLIPS